MSVPMRYLALCTLLCLVGCDDSARSLFGEQAQTETETEPQTAVLSIDNFNARMPIAASLQLTLTTTQTDGTAAAPTSSVTWTSSDETVATVDGGRVVGVAEGTAAITASADGLTVTSDLEIYPVLLSAVEFNPDPVNLNECGVGSVAVSGTFADGTRFGLLPPLDFSPPAGVSVSETQLGVDISANDAGTFTVPFTRSSVNDTLQVVASDTLAAIAPSQTQVSIATGETAALTASGSFNDGSSEDITSRGTWSIVSSTQPDTVTLSTDTPGSLTGGSTGSATVRFACGGLQSDVAVLVDPADIVQYLSLEGGATELDMAAGEQRTLSLTAHYADGSEAEVADQAEWSITLGDAVNIAVGNTAPDKGVVTVQPGVTTETSAVVEARLGTAATLIQVFAERP